MAANVNPMGPNQGVVELHPVIRERLEQLKQKYAKAVDAAVPPTVAVLTRATKEKEQMMDIQTKLANIHSLAEFRTLIDSAQPGVTFWGWRHIRILHQGSVESIPIDFLVNKVNRLVEEARFEYTPEERANGAATAAKISELYQASDTVLKHACVLTRIFCSIREWYNEWGNITNLRINWNYFYCHAFEYYTPQQFQDAYHLTLEEAKQRGLNIKHRWDPVRYKIVPSDEIELYMGSAGPLYV